MNTARSDPKSGSQPPTQQSSMTNPAAMELMQPGPEHSQLAKQVGSWDVVFTHAMKEGEPGKKAKGQATFTSAYNGRFICEAFASHFDGREFAGTGVTGYDRAAKHFVTTWYDNTGTGITFLTGKPMREGLEITYHGTTTRPDTGAMQIRHVVSWDSDDRFSLTMFNRSDGKERKFMELVYTRRV